VPPPDTAPLRGMLGQPTTDRSAAPDATPPTAGDWRAVGSVEHVFTHFALTLDVWSDQREGEGEGDFLWTEPDAALKALPTVFRKALERVLA
jgi:A/G-specific adenine glycosylase